MQYQGTGVAQAALYAGRAQNVGQIAKAGTRKKELSASRLETITRFTCATIARQKVELISRTQV